MPVAARSAGISHAAVRGPWTPWPPTRKRSNAMRTRIDKAIKAIAPRARRHHLQQRGSPSGGPAKALRRAERVGAHPRAPAYRVITDDIPPTTGTNNSIVAGATGPADRQRRPDRRTQEPRYATATTPSRPSTANSTIIGQHCRTAAPLPSLATLDTVAAGTSDPHPALGTNTSEPSMKTAEVRQSPGS